MVHSKPEYAESVKLLTYSQLRRLEKMDLKKAREQKLLELAGHGIEAFGRTMQGSITGPVILALGLTALYPGWAPVVGAGAAVIAKDIGNAWKNSILPDISSILGRDDTNGTYGIGETTSDGTMWDGTFWWYTDSLARDAALVILSVEHPLHVQKVDRRGSAAAGWVMDATPAGSTPNPTYHRQYIITETFQDGSTHIIPAGIDPAQAQIDLAYLQRSVPSIYKSVTLSFAP